MAEYKITRGLDLPIIGRPEQKISAISEASQAALLGYDYHGLKPALLVEKGSKVKVGTPIFFDRRYPKVQFTSPMGGEIKDIHRGEKRVLQSVVVEKTGIEEHEKFDQFGDLEIETAPIDRIKEVLFSSGAWTAIRQRPFGVMPDPNSECKSIFVTAIDTNPYGFNPELVINKYKKEFLHGLKVLMRLTEGRVHVCQGPRADIPRGKSPKVVHHEFSGPHPAGLVGTHIHLVDPVVNPKKTVWYLGYQDVIAMGTLLLTGRVWTDRYVSLGGTHVKRPRILQTRLGAATNPLLEGELFEGENRIISGSVIYGREAKGAYGFLSRFQNILSVIKEDRSREFQGFLSPGLNKFSVKSTFVSSLFSNKTFSFGTNRNGSKRDIVPIGSYESVFPFDMEPVFIARALISNDLDRLEVLGALELAGEDMALCTYVCPGKNEYSDLMEQALLKLQVELT